MTGKALQIEFLSAGFNHNNKPLSAGKVYTYEVGGTTPKVTWVDSDKVSPSTNPIILDSDGRAEVYADGRYRLLVTDSDDVTVHDFDDYNYPSESLDTIFVIATDYGDGSLTQATIEAAILSIGGADATLYLSPGNWIINDDMTIPINIELKLAYGAYMTVAVAKTVTISGTLDENLFYWKRGAGSYVISDIKTPITYSYWDDGVTNQTNISGNLLVNTTTFFVDSTNSRVGIGTVSPTVELDLVGTGLISEALTVGTNLIVDTDLLIVDSALRFIGINKAIPTVELDIVGSSSLTEALIVGTYLTVDSPTFFVDSVNHRVGIGTITPAVTLDIIGSLALLGDLIVDTDLLVVDSINNRVGINKAAPTVELDVIGAGLFSTTLETGTTLTVGTNLIVTDDLTVNTNTLFVNSSTNRVGIGNIIPSFLLDVSGEIGTEKIALSNQAGVGVKVAGYALDSFNFVSWDSEIFDNGNMWDSGVDDTYIEIKETGFYLILIQATVKQTAPVDWSAFIKLSTTGTHNTDFMTAHTFIPSSVIGFGQPATLFLCYFNLFTAGELLYTKIGNFGGTLPTAEEAQMQVIRIW